MASQTDNPGLRLRNIAQTTQILIHHDDPSRFVSTFAERAALKILKSYGSIFIKGKSGSGKSRIGLKLLDDISKEKGVQPLLLTSYREWNLVPKTEGKRTDATHVSPKYIVMIENIFGSSNLVQTRVDEWSRLFDIMWPAVESGHIYLIVTSRPDISAQCESQVKKYKLIENIQCITLDSGPYALRNGEKKKLMRMYCGKLTFSDEEIRRAIEVDGALGFPQCCKYFASSSKAKAKGIEFFFKPYEYITEEIEILQESDPLGYLVLLLVLMNGGHLANTPVRSPKKKQQIEALIENGLCSLPSPPSSSAILTKAESLRDVYLEKIDDKFQFHHQSIFDAVFAFVSRICPDMFLGICPAKLFVEMVKTETYCTKSNEVVVMVPRDNYGVLADRLTELLLSENSLVVLDHPALHDEEFTDVMFEKWKDEEKLMDILTFTMPYELEIKIGQPVSDGCLFKCKFILPCLLLKQIRNLTDLLNVVLTDGSPTVMLTELLACAVYLNNFTLANRLLNMDVTPDENSFRALCGSPYTSSATDEIAKHIISVVTEDMELKDIFCAAVLKDKHLVVQHLFESKLKKREMTILNEWLERLCDLLSKKGENAIDTSHSNRTMEDITEKMIETACMPDPEFLLWMAATHPVSVILKHLLRMDLDVNEQFFDSKPLFQALSFGVADNVALLLEHGVDICKTKDNRVLHLAAKSGFHSEQKTYILCSYLESRQDVIPTSQEDSNDPEDVGYSENPDDQREWVDLEDQENTEDQEDGDTQDDVQNDEESSEMQEDVGEQENGAVPVLLEYFLNTQYIGEMPIHSACSADNAGSLGVLIQAGADVNAQTAEKSTPLHVAVKKGSVECVKLLLQANASVNVINLYNNSPLTCSDKTDYEIVKALVNAGTYVNHSGRCGRTCLHLALQNNDLATVRLLCDHGADVNTAETEGVTVLMMAALHGEIHMMKLLCEKGAKLDTRDEKGETVLHKAAISTIDAAEKLLYLFGFPHAPIDIEDNAGRTALYPGVQSGDIEVIQIIRDKGLDLLKCDQDGNNALHAACKVGVEDFDTLSTLFGNSFGHINQQNNYGETVLYLLVRGKISCDFKQLLDRGANPNIASADGRTVLHVAVEKGKLELVELLLQREADPRVVDRTGMTPLHIASQSGFGTFVKLLLKHGSVPNAVDENGRTSIHLACENLYEWCVQELLKGDADPCAVDKEGLTPLHLCVGVDIGVKALKRKMFYPLYSSELLMKSVEKSRNCIMKMLLDAGANPNVSDNIGTCILYVASTEQCAESSVKILLEAGADVSATYRHGRTLLHFVAAKGIPEVYRLLVDSGADENMRDQSGGTPLQIMTERMRKNTEETDPNLVANIGRNIGFPFSFSQQYRQGAFTKPFDLVQPFFNASYTPFPPPKNVSASVTSVETETDLVSPKTESHLKTRLERDDRTEVESEEGEKSTPLHVAVKKGSVECVKLLLQANASVNVIDSDNNSPLTCSDKTDYEIVKALVNAGADVNYSGRCGRTCLHLALQNNDLATVRLLCDHGADVNTAETEGVTVLMMAALNGEIHMMKLLCEKGAKLDTRDEKGETVLHKAAISTIDAAEKLLYLFGFPHAPIDIEDNAGRTALYPGVQSGDIEVIQIIRDKGLDLLKCDQDGNNALHAACKVGVEDFDTLSTLFGNSFGHINQQNNYGETVLYLLVHGNISCDFKQLLDRGANPNIASANGRTVLHVAVEKGKLELVELLLQREADPRVVDQTGMTPLHIASQRGYNRLVKLLLKHGSVPNAVNENGRTSIHLACETLYVWCVQELLKEDADPCAVDKEGLTPLHVCVGVNIGMIALERKMLYPQAHSRLLMKSVEKSRNCIMKMLLDAGANPNVSDNEGKCILYVACTQQNAEFPVKILLEAGADASATDPDGRSLLHFVAERGMLEVYHPLVASGADEYMRDQSGRTPLQIMTKIKRKSPKQSDPNFLANIMKHMGLSLTILQPSGFGYPCLNDGNRYFLPPRIVSASVTPVETETCVMSPNSELHPETGAEGDDRRKVESEEGEDQTIVYLRDESIDSD